MQRSSSAVASSSAPSRRLSPGLPLVGSPSWPAPAPPSSSRASARACQHHQPHHQHHALASRRSRATPLQPCRATEGSKSAAAAEQRAPDVEQPPPAPPPAPASDSNLAYTLGMAALWIGLTAYAFFLSPNQTPYRDQIFIKLLVGLREPGEEFVVNQVYTALFNIMGIWPIIYSALLVPAGRSANKLPAWPFLTLSFGFGVFALFPYFTFWRPDRTQQLPPPKEELEGLNKLLLKGAETPVLPALLLVGALSMFYLAATAGPESWAEYGKLLEESRLVHVTTLDFMCLTAFAPFWMQNDAEGRNWEGRNTALLPVLSVLPVVGPAIYLLLRPKAK